MWWATFVRRPAKFRAGESGFGFQILFAETFFNSVIWIFVAKFNIIDVSPASICSKNKICFESWPRRMFSSNCSQRSPPEHHQQQRTDWVLGWALEGPTDYIVIYQIFVVGFFMFHISYTCHWNVLFALSLPEPIFVTVYVEEMLRVTSRVVCAQHSVQRQSLERCFQS